jgi:tRNA-uridine 2-sulfurtransferase
MSRRLVVAMSGGVDSSVAAALLVRAGWEVVGVTLQLRSCEDRAASRSCCAADGITQARAVAGHLGIPHYVLDCREAFEATVLRPAWEAYQAGRTPSPCLLCNRDIKFGLLGEYAARIGAARIATGHYARLEQGREGRVLRRGIDRAKDQSYFLSALSLDQLRTLELPLGGLSKPEVRALARELGLATAERHESQDACLDLDGLGFQESLRLRFGAEARRGPILDMEGRLLGEHAGFHRYTLGQRRGLRVPLGKRAHVAGLRAGDGAVILSTERADLLSGSLCASGVHWFTEPPERALVQIRSRHPGAMATLSRDINETVTVKFDAPQWAVTPGQAVAFYADDRLVGGGWIAST